MTTEALYWSQTAKIGFIPCDSRTKKVYENQWQNLDLNAIDYERNEKVGLYKNGIAIRLGRCLAPYEQRFSFALDFDGWDAVAEWFGNWENVLEMSKKTRIEWHGDRGKLHMILFSSNRAIKNKKIHVKDGSALLEIRCENNLLFSYPSYHMDGNQYVPLGTYEIAILAESQLLELEAKIDSLCESFMSDENKQKYITWLEDPNTKIREGEGRHPATKTLGCSFFYRYNNDEWKDLTDDQRKEKLLEWNQQHCIPPLPEKEFNDIWKWIIEKHRRVRDEEREERQRQQQQNQQNQQQQQGEDPFNMPGCVWYQINSHPDKYILGTPDNKLVEVERRWKTDSRSGMMTSHLVTNKTFTACKPVKIIKHTNPLSFLELLQRYTKLSL